MNKIQGGNETRMFEQMILRQKTVVLLYEGFEMLVGFREYL